MRLKLPVPNAMPVYAKQFIGLLTLSYYMYASEDLSQTITSLNERIATLENQRSTGILHLSSSDTTMFLGGRIALDTIYLSDANGKEGGANNNDQFFGASYIPLDSQGEKDELTLSARNSKFWIKTRTQQEQGEPLMTLLEFDFWGSSGNERNTNSHNLRLRHAYLLYNGWTIGQTNSLFIGTSKPHTLLAPVNNILMRQPLISYKHKFSQSSLALSLEEPESLLLTPEGDKITINDDRLPDVVLRYEYHQPLYAYSLSLLERQLRINQEKGVSTEADTLGYGVNMTGHLTIYQNDTISWGASWGKGIGRYLATGFFPDAIISENETLKAQKSWGGDIAYEHWLRNNLRFDIALGFIGTDNLLDDPTLDQASYSEHFGLQYSPLPKLLIATEYIHAQRTLEDKSNHHLNRLYLRVSYDF